MNLEQQCNAIVRQGVKRRKRFRLPINPDFYRMLTLERLVNTKAYKTFSLSLTRTPSGVITSRSTAVFMADRSPSSTRASDIPTKKLRWPSAESLVEAFYERFYHMAYPGSPATPARVPPALH